MALIAPRTTEIAMTLSDDLNKLDELRARGALTDEEYTRAKERLLNAGNTSSSAPFVSAVNTFRRSRTDRWIAGVCGGLGRLTGMESWVWRLFFTVLFFCAGTGLLVYVLLALFVPSDDAVPPARP
jgi:phage shock protein PspC (stress-responsive transcriptional regulator)